MNFCALLLQNSSSRLLLKAKHAGNVILLKVVCLLYTTYYNAFVKMFVFGVVPIVPSVLAVLLMLSLPEDGSGLLD